MHSIMRVGIAVFFLVAVAAGSVSGEMTTEPAGLSLFEEYIAGILPKKPLENIRQFGYDLFEATPSTFAPVTDVPVGPDYFVGPGDELKVSVWGMVEGNWIVKIERDGTVTLPKIGVIAVAGLSFAQMKEFLHREFSRLYTDFQLNVTIGALRTMRVYVVGQAKSPGAYTISSLSTAVNALFEAGGPAKTGTMRDIQVKRGGQTVTHLDLYDFLIKGDRGNDIRLMPEDVVFIPPVGPLAGITGGVKKPAIYEMKGETRLLDVIQMAGGFTGIAFKGRVQIERTENYQFRNVIEGDLIEIEVDNEKNLVLRDGDLVKIFSVVERKDTVSIEGAVPYPGLIGIEPGKTTLGEAIALSGGRLYYASDEAEITRVTVTPEGPVTTIFVVDTRKAIEGDPESNVILEKNDYVFVKNVPDWELYNTVTITGQVQVPGTYTIRKGEKLSTLLKRAGGFTKYAYLKGAFFTRERVRELQDQQLRELIDRLEREILGTGAVQTSTASSSDEARLLQIELEQKRKFVQNLREVRAQGRVALTLLPIDEIEGTSYDVALENGDTLHVPSNPGTVQVAGSVYNQTAFFFEEGKSYKHYINLAGGFTSHADEDNVYVLKASGTAIRKKNGIAVEPGDTIAVPEKIERIAWMRNIKDITQIMYQIAVTAGVLIVLF